jgi:hypothetical protein
VQALSHADLAGAPLLLLFNKKDLAGAEGAAAAEKLLGALACETAERSVRCQPCCALSGEGLREGLAWATEASRTSRRTRLLTERAYNAR